MQRVLRAVLDVVGCLAYSQLPIDFTVNDTAAIEVLMACDSVSSIEIELEDIKASDMATLA